MRLINVDTMELVEFQSDIPPYAILSHTWGPPDEEVSFGDLQKHSDLEYAKAKATGLEKVRGCCQQAKMNGLKYVWIDTCCIDKTNFTELHEAINSMFRWYKEAETCYAYLVDVPPVKEDNPAGQIPGFARSRWFKRGWTLQELVAPSEVVFFRQDWTDIGTRKDLAHKIENITGIPPAILRNDDDDALYSVSVAQRMPWAACRETTHDEDRAYCLQGIFDVSISMNYGEGGKKAFIRLQEEIAGRRRDPSIFAWGPIQTNGCTFPTSQNEPLSDGIWAWTPSAFSGSGNIVVWNQRPLAKQSVQGDCLQTDLALLRCEDGTIYGLLSCGPKNCQQDRCPSEKCDCETQVVGLPLVKLLSPKIKGFSPDEYARIDWHGTTARLPQSYGKIQGNAHDTGKDTVTQHHYLAKLRPNLTSFYAPKDVIVVASLTTSMALDCHVMLLSDETHLADLHASIEYMRPGAFGKHSAVIGDSTVSADICTEETGPWHTVKLRVLTSKPHVVSVDADTEMMHVDRKLQLVAAFDEESKLIPTARTAAKDKNTQHDKLVANTIRLVNVQNQLLELDTEKRRLQEEAWKIKEEAKKREDECAPLERDRSDLTDRIAALLHKIDDNENDQAVRDKYWLERLLSTMAAQRICDDKTGEAAAGRAFKNLSSSESTATASRSANTTAASDPLLWAARRGHTATLRFLVEKGMSIDRSDGDGTTPLMLAARAGDETAVRLLLAKGACLEKMDCHGHRPLAHAILEQNLAMIQLLLQCAADVDAETSSGKTPLEYAAQWGCVETVQQLLARGANRNAKGGYDKPLFQAAASGHAAVARLLVKQGAQVNAKSIDGDTPLILGAREGHRDVVQLLLDLGACIDHPDARGTTALCISSMRGDDDVARLLLDRGAQIDGQDGTGTTPFRYTVQAHEETAPLFAEADPGLPDRKEPYGQTVLHCVSMYGRCEFAKLFIARGADVNAVCRGERPLDIARRHGHVDMEQLLRENGAVSYGPGIEATLTGSGAIVAAVHPGVGSSGREAAGGLRVPF